MMTIGDVVVDVHYGTSRKASDTGLYTYLRMNNITYGGELDLTDSKKIDVPDSEIDGCLVRQGDVLFNRTNSKELVGKTCVFTESTPMVIAGYIIRVRPGAKITGDYLATYLNLSESKKMLFSMAKGAVGQANINAKELCSISIIVPPMKLQRQFQKFKLQTDKSKLVVYYRYKLCKLFTMNYIFGRKNYVY